MKLIVILFILFSFNSLGQTNLEKKIFEDYTVSIPENWTNVRESFLDTLRELNHYPQRSYIAGFKDSDSLSFPYVIFQFIEVIQPENGSNFDTISAMHIKKFRERGIESEVIKSVLNTRFYLEFSKENVPVFAGMIYGKNGFVDISFYADYSNKKRSFKLFEQIYNSVQLNVPSKNNTKLADSEKEMKDSGKLLAIATIFIVLVGGIRWFIKRTQKE